MVSTATGSSAKQDSNRPVACKALGIHYILIEREVTFGVLGGLQKCIGIYGKIAMPFKFRATPQLYGMCYLSEYSVKLETLANTWNFDSGELIVAFSRNAWSEVLCMR